MTRFGNQNHGYRQQAHNSRQLHLCYRTNMLRRDRLRCVWLLAISIGMGPARPVDRLFSERPSIGAGNFLGLPGCVGFFGIDELVG
jgi:hypothetical protein